MGMGGLGIDVESASPNAEVRMNNQLFEAQSPMMTRMTDPETISGPQESPAFDNPPQSSKASHDGGGVTQSQREYIAHVSLFSIH